MTAHLQTLASYVPSLILRRANRNPSALTEPVVEKLTAGILFADVAGFTALTEQLAAQGAAGAEDLTRLLNDYFGQIIDLVIAYGGDPAKFAGDALLALWQSDGSDEDSARLVREIGQCSLLLQDRLHDYEVAESFRLRMKLAIGVGEVWCEHLGGVYDRWEFLLAGPPLAQVGAANDHARPGDTIVSKEAWALIGDKCTGEACPDGAMRLSSVNETVPIVPAELPQPRPTAGSALRTFIPGAIRARLDAGQTDWLGELRRISVLFIGLPDFSADAALGKAHEAMRSMQKALYQFEGSLNKISVDDKGASLIAVLGLPPLAHEDDPERAVRAALAIQTNLRDMNFRSSIGITTGLAFCGAVGNEKRREYTIMGDVVNLSARLMQAAKGELLCDRPTWNAAKDRLRFEVLDPIKVKGKTDLIPIYRPAVDQEAADQSTDGPHWSDRMFGREAERKLFDDRLEALLANGHGSRLVIEGEPGMGKSHLLQQFQRRAAGRGALVLAGAGDPIETATPYRAWRRVFNRLYPLDLFDTDLPTKRAKLLDLLPDDPEIRRLAPLLDVVMPLDWQDNDDTAALTGKARAERTQALLTDLLQRAAALKPLALFLNDVNWIDSASWALLECVAREVRPLLLTITARPFGPGSPEGYTSLLSGADAAHLMLDGLAPEEVTALVCHRLGCDDLPDAVAKVLVEKAEGNPMYCEELAYALRDNDLISIQDRQCIVNPEAGNLGQAELPDTVQGWITSRIDRLTPAEQMTMKVASVVGRVFDLDVLRDIFPIDAERAQVERHCAVLHSLDLTPRLDSGDAFKFKSNVTQDVAYGLMLFAQRRQLHQRLAEWFETHNADDLSAYYPFLAYHWRKAAEDRTPDPELVEKALDYYEKSAAQAVRTYANQEAIGFFNEALALLQKLPDTDERARRELRLQLALGAPLIASSSYAAPEVRQAYQRAGELCRRVGDHAQLFHALRGMWQFHIGQAAYAEARKLGDELLALAESADDDALLIEAYRAVGNTAFWIGDFVAAREQMERAVSLYDPDRHGDLAARYGQDPDVANRGILAWTLCYLGYPDAAKQQAEATVERARALDHPFSLIYAYGASMWTYQFLRDAPAAERWARAAIDLAAEREFPYLGAAGKVVHGWAVAAQGDVAAGLAEIGPALAAWREAGGGIGMPLFLTVLADTQLLAGQYEAALKTLDDPLLVDRLRIEDWYGADIFRIRGACRLASGDDPETVLAIYEQGLALASRQHARLIELRLAQAIRDLSGVMPDERVARILSEGLPETG